MSGQFQPTLASTVLRPCFTRAYSGGVASDTTTSSQTKLLGATYRIQLYCTANCSQIQLVFGNSVHEALAPNDIVVKASVEDSDGNRWLVWFGGGASRTATVTPGGFLISDPVGLSVAKGGSVFVRTYVTGTTVWLGNVRQDTGEGTADTDEVDSGTGADTLALGYAYTPYAMLGQVHPRTRVYGLVGTSITRGLNAAGAATGYDNPHFIRAMGAHYGADVSHVLLAKNGETALTFSTPGNRKLRTRLLNGCTDVILDHAVNDLTAGLSAMQARTTAIASSMQVAGLNVWLCTITPVTTSSDVWTTLVNQTVGANEATRLAYNAWIRTRPLSAVGVIDVADAAESSRDSGKWAVNITMTTDGLHPTGEAAAAQMATAMIAASPLPTLL